MIKVDEIVNTIYKSKTYLVTEEGCKDLYIVDCGDVSPIVEYIGLHGLTLKGILLTHIHFDHIYGIVELVSRYPDCVVYTNEDGKKGLANDRLNMSHYQDFFPPIIYPYDNVSVLEDGDVIPLCQEQFVSLFTPGHNKSCVSYRLGPYLFTGDSYMPDYQSPVCHRVDKELMRENEQKLRLMAEKDKLIVKAGH